MKILQMISSVAIATSIATVAAIVSPVTANAATFTFDNIAGGDTFGDTLNGFLSMDVTSENSGVLFNFKYASNTVFPKSFISDIYIDVSPKLLGIPTINNTTDPNVSFSQPSGKQDQQLPQGGNGFTTDIYFAQDQGAGNAKAIQPGESLSVFFANTKFDDVISAINTPTGLNALRVGYHVQGIGDKSDSYINAKPVPVPGFVLGVMAAGALGSTRLLKKKQAA